LFKKTNLLKFLLIISSCIISCSDAITKTVQEHFMQSEWKMCRGCWYTDAKMSVQRAESTYSGRWGL